MERYRRLRKEKFIKTLKFLIIVLLVLFMSCGLFMVNNTIKYFDIIENDNLINLDIKNKTIEMLGKTYYINLKFIKDIF